MGRDKALLEIDGRPMAQRVADALWGAGAAEVFCVGGDPALRSHGVRLVPDDRPGEGPLGGLVTALREAAHDLVVVLACDLIDPSIAAVERLVDAAEGGRAVAAAIIPVVGNRAQWLHGAWWRDGVPSAVALRVRRRRTIDPRRRHRPRCPVSGRHRSRVR